MDKFLLLLLIILATVKEGALAFLASKSGGPCTTKNSRLLLRAGKNLEQLLVTDSVEGTGETAKFGAIVTVNYEGFLLEDGTLFDTSMISFKLGYGKVLEGCDKGIKGMRVGGKRVLKIPSKLGFGSAGFGPEPYSVPKNADLEFRVELLSVASGPMSEAAANMGIGLNPKTVYLK